MGFLFEFGLEFMLGLVFWFLLDVGSEYVLEFGWSFYWIVYRSLCLLLGNSLVEIWVEIC